MFWVTTYVCPFFHPDEYEFACCLIEPGVEHPRWRPECRAVIIQVLYTVFGRPVWSKARFLCFQVQRNTLKAQKCILLKSNYTILMEARIFYANSHVQYEKVFPSELFPKSWNCGNTWKTKVIWGQCAVLPWGRLPPLPRWKLHGHNETKDRSSND